MKKKLLLIIAVLGTVMCLHASQRITQSFVSSGAALGGNIPRNRPNKSMAERLFEKHRPQPHKQPRR